MVVAYGNPLPGMAVADAVRHVEPLGQKSAAPLGGKAIPCIKQVPRNIVGVVVANNDVIQVLANLRYRNRPGRMQQVAATPDCFNGRDFDNPAVRLFRWNFQDRHVAAAIGNNKRAAVDPEQSMRIIEARGGYLKPVFTFDDQFTFSGFDLDIQQENFIIVIASDRQLTVIRRKLNILGASQICQSSFNAITRHKRYAWAKVRHGFPSFKAGCIAAGRAGLNETPRRQLVARSQYAAIYSCWEAVAETGGRPSPGAECTD